MWKCSNCHHVEFTTDKPEHCPVCGAEADKLLPHEVPRIKGTKTLQNLKAGFVAESQAHQRNLAFALKAEQEDYPQMAKLFRAIAEAEGRRSRRICIESWSRYESRPMAVCAARSASLA